MNINEDAVSLHIEEYGYDGHDRFGDSIFGEAFFDDFIEIDNFEYLVDVVIDLHAPVKTITVSNCSSLVKLKICEQVNHLNIVDCPHLKKLDCSQSTPGLDLSHLSELEKLTVICPSVLLPDKKFKLLDLTVEKINLTRLYADELSLPIKLYESVEVMSGANIIAEATKTHLSDLRHKKNDSSCIDVYSSCIVLCCVGLKLCWGIKYPPPIVESPCCMFLFESGARKVLSELLMACFLK